MGRWRTVGALWKSTKSTNKAVLYGSIENEEGKKLKVAVYPNEDPVGRQPQYRIASADEWELDEYFDRNKAKNEAEPADDQEEINVDDIFG